MPKQPVGNAQTGWRCSDKPVGDAHQSLLPQFLLHVPQLLPVLALALVVPVQVDPAQHKVDPQQQRLHQHKGTSNKSMPMRLKNRNIAHTSVPKICPLQKNALSTGFPKNCLECVSNFHT